MVFYFHLFYNRDKTIVLYFFEVTGTVRFPIVVRVVLYFFDPQTGSLSLYWIPCRLWVSCCLRADWVCSAPGNSSRSTHHLHLEGSGRAAARVPGGMEQR